MLWREAACASIGVAVAIDKASTVMSVFMLSLLSGPFEAAGRLPQLKIKRWAVGTIKLPFRKLNSNLSEQVEQAAGGPRAALCMTQVSRSFACFEETELASATVDPIVTMGTTNVRWFYAVRVYVRRLCSGPLPAERYSHV